ncbi:MAG: gallate dioxygenase [Nostocoides sp.]
MADPVMAKIVGGIGASHSPTIGYAVETGKQGENPWAPIFAAGFDHIRAWVRDQRVDVLFVIYNDHITSFFLDHYSAFVLGVDESYVAADEGGGAPHVAPLTGHAELAGHIGAALVADEFDMSFFQGRPADHGLFSALSTLADGDGPWAGRIVPLQVGVLQLPVPSPRRCYTLGKSLRAAIESFPDPDLKVAVMATGGLSHQVHGERAGFLNEEWDARFLDLLEADPQQLANLRIADFVELGGAEGAEVIMWLIMRGALSEDIRRVHRSTYAPSMTNIATAIWEDLGTPPPEAELAAYREHVGYQLAGADTLEGTYPYTLERSRKGFRVNDFLHRLIEPDHRRRFVEDFDALATQYRLASEERQLIADRDWIGLIRYGAIFFVLEKMAAVLGISNPEVYAHFRGETLDEFQASRQAAIQYGVGAREEQE